MNNGDWGNDAYNMILEAAPSTWLPTLYNSVGLPLYDTTGDGIMDTGAIAKGGGQDLYLRVVAPLTALPGDAVKVKVTATSIVSGRSVSSWVDVAVPSEFAQVFVDAGVELRQIWKENVVNRMLVDKYTGTTFSMEAVSPEKYFVAWEERSAITASGRILKGIELLEDGRFIYQGRLMTSAEGRPFTDIPYRLSHVVSGPGAVGSLTNVASVMSQNPSLLWAHAGAPVMTAVNTLAINGNIVAAWKFSMTNSAYDTNVNLYLTLLNSAGVPVVSQPYNVTGDTAWTRNAHKYQDNKIVALGDGKYALCWIDGNAHEIHCSFFVLSGNALVRVGGDHVLVANTAGEYQPNELNIAAVTDSNLLVVYNTTYTGSDTTQPASKMYYQVINSNAVTPPVQAGTQISGANGESPRAVQVGENSALLVWSQYDGRLGYARIDNNLMVSTFPRYFERAYNRMAKFPSVAVNRAGYTIITWVDGDANEYIYYTLLNGAADVVTQPLSMISNPFANPTFKTSEFGYGNARYSGIYLNELPVVGR